MDKRPSLPLGRQITYAIGQLGWSILINVISLMLVYFYLPPENAGLPFLITQVTFLGVLNAITLIAASGRLVDAVTDPIIASLSDRFSHKRGRRIPFLAVGAFPAALFCLLMFLPPDHHLSGTNIVWLVIAQILFYIAFTAYVTPYFALLPELGHTANERLNLSTWISVTYALGIIAAAQTPAVADLFQSALGLTERLAAIQYAVGTMAVVALGLMLVPVFTIDEKKYCAGVPSTVPLFEALRSTFRNLNFRYYVVADFSYFMGLTIINTGLLYYVTVLLFLEEALVGTLLAVMIIISFLFYPLVNLLAKRVGKKILVVLSFLSMSFIFMGIYFMGRFPFPAQAQAYLLVILYALPLSFLSVLPNAILADIAEHDALKSGERKEGMFFAARTLMQKFGQTFGILFFAALTTFGKDPGDDLGIRLSGLVGWGLCLLAGIVFFWYNEKRVLQETEQLQIQATT
jgi:GPH family glycoside/pentoside/hexuronide:cation symporter